MAETCPRCKGEKKIWKADLMKAKNVRVMCPDCDGSGFKDAETPDGVRLRIEQKTLPVYAEYVIDGRVKTQAFFLVAMEEIDGKPHLRARLQRLETYHKHDRHKGYAASVITQFATQTQMPVYEITTSWSDSTQAGKDLLQKLGFVREGKDLVLRRKMKEGADGGDTESRPEGSSECSGEACGGKESSDGGGRLPEAPGDGESAA